MGLNFPSGPHCNLTNHCLYKHHSGQIKLHKLFLVPCYGKRTSCKELDQDIWSSRCTPWYHVKFLCACVSVWIGGILIARFCPENGGNFPSNTMLACVIGSADWSSRFHLHGTSLHLIQTSWKGIFKQNSLNEEREWEATGRKFIWLNA